MKKLFSGLLLGLVITVLITMPVLAGYYAALTVTEANGTDYTQLGLQVSADIDLLSTEGYITSTGLDTRVEYSTTDLPHMLVDDRIMFVSDIDGDGTANLQFTTGDTALSNFDVIVGDGGYVTVSDHANLELGDDFEIEIDGYISTVLEDDDYLYDESEGEDDWVVGYSDGAGSQSKESDHLYIYASDGTGSAERTYVTDAVVSLERIDSVWVDWANTGSASSDNNSYLVASTVKANSHSTSDAVVSQSSAFARTTTELDVSSLDGDYYIRVHAYDASGSARTSEIKVYGVYLEYGLYPVIVKTDAFQVYSGDGDIIASLIGGSTLEVTATIASGEYIVNVWADTTNFGIDIDGSTEDSIALGGVSSNDNANDFILSPVYWDYYNHTTSSTLRIDYSPDSIIEGTTLPNEDNPGTYDGTLTFGANPAGVTVTLGGLVSDFQPVPAGGGTELPTPQDIVGETGQPGFTEDLTGLTTHPLYPLVSAVNETTGFPVNMIWIMGATFIVLGAMIVGFAYIPHHIITVLIGGGLYAFFWHQGILPFWGVFIFAAGGLAVVLSERVQSY